MPKSVEMIELYRFRYFDRLCGRWLRARYRATLEELAARHEKWETIGTPEIRRVPDPTRLNASHLVSKLRDEL